MIKVSRFALFSILLLLVCSKGYCTSFPDNILFKTYAEQIHLADSIREAIYDNEYEQIFSSLDEMKTRAEAKGDVTLKNIFEYYKFLATFEKRKTTPDYESNLLAFIKQTDENHQDAVKAEAFELLADYYWEIKKYALSLENYLYAYESYSPFTLQDFPHKIDYLYKIGGRYYYFRDYNTAKKYFLEVWHDKYSESINNPTSKLNTMGLCYSNLDKNDSAIYYLTKACDQAVRQKDEVWIGIISGNLAQVKIKQKKINEALPLFEKNIELSRNHHNLSDLAVSLSEYGALLFTRNEHKRNMEMQMEALDIINKKNWNTNYPITSRVYPNIAKAYADAGNMALAYSYLDSAKQAKDSVEKIKNSAFVSGVQHKIDTEKHMAELHKKESEIKNQRRFKNMLLFGLILLLLLVFFILRNLSNQKKSNIIISAEKMKSETLLLNILPSEVAEELKQSGMSEAKQYEKVSVLFTDFVGFTLVSEKLTPQELVEEIHYCFTAFDEIIDRNELEKIKTIGDAYLAVCGMPVEDRDHATKTVQAALEISEFIANREQQGGKFKIRIGINSGPVVAGIVGVKKFAYDIWGDTVNTAARMEQNSVNGKINISGSTYELVKNDFHCIPRGKIAAKNKGEVDMYFVERKS